MEAEDESRDVGPTEDVDDSEVEIWERVCQINDIVDQIGIQHPIIYDIYDLCQYYKNDKLCLFNISMLRAICVGISRYHSSQEIANLTLF
ncbi:Hypothetical predicted protein [Paramuricea clavata]|uniref:Uncharacterized protein n=1 Tax=Paramuricea clavata TaxID=317549 RepID=A0A7D9IYC7_PARCT|nr:Hypothetical predicted protein [Paramuricea clavata]